MFGISENVKEPAIPRIQLDFKFKEVHLRLLLALNSLGYLLACGYTGYYCHQIDSAFKIIRKKDTSSINIISEINCDEE